MNTYEYGIWISDNCLTNGIKTKKQKTFNGEKENKKTEKQS